MHHSTTIAGLFLGVVLPLNAQSHDWEITLGLVNGESRKADLNQEPLNQAGDAKATSLLDGPPRALQADVGFELYRTPSARWWVQLGYAAGLGTRDYTYDVRGISTAVDRHLAATLKTSYLAFGVHVALPTQHLGEVLLGFEGRRYSLALDGVQHFNSALTPAFSESYSFNDVILQTGLGFTVRQQEISQVHRFTLGFSLAGPSSTPTLASETRTGGPGKEVMARHLPGLEIKYSYGLRF